MIKLSLFAKPRRFGDSVLKIKFFNLSISRCTWNHNGKNFELRKVTHPKFTQIYITFFKMLYKIEVL